MEEDGTGPGPRKAPGAATTKPRLPIGEVRHVDHYSRLNLIAESQHGIVYRARNKATQSIVALKKFKTRKEPDGFPITFLREINILFTIKHPNIITAEEMVFGGAEEDLAWFLVMEYVDHDLKDLITAMKTPFLEGHVKHFMLQMLSAVAALHETWLVHRDLKTTNLLVNSKGTLKVCDFGMARHCGSPDRPYTDEVISRWYRPPEILLGRPTYSTGVDIWSIGCIFGELLQRGVTIPGNSEVDQVDKAFTLVGTPTPESWPEYAALAKKKNLNFPVRGSTLRKKFPKIGYEPAYVHGEQCTTTSLSPEGFDMLEQMLLCNPETRITAADCLEHPYFQADPDPLPLTPEQLAQLKRDRGQAILDAKKAAEAKAHAEKLAAMNPYLAGSMGGIGMGGMQVNAGAAAARAAVAQLGMAPPRQRYLG